MSIQQAGYYKDSLAQCHETFCAIGIAYSYYHFLLLPFMAIFGFDHLAVRLWAFANDFMVFASSAIVTGVISYFLNEYSLRSAHIVYQEVIVC